MKPQDALSRFIWCMADDPSYILDLSHGGDNQSAGAGEPPSGQEGGARPWVGVRFECCGVYTRIYRNRQGDAYEGRCPRCNRPVRLRVGPGGTSSRMFRAE